MDDSGLGNDLEVPSCAGLSVDRVLEKEELASRIRCEVSQISPSHHSTKDVPSADTLTAANMTSIEEITDDIQDVDEEEGEEDDGGGDVAISDAIQSKAERKSRKSFQGIGLKKVAGVNRVTMRRPRGHLLVVTNPEVYKSSISDCYVVFGELKTEDTSAQAQAAQAQQMAQAEQQERLLTDQFSQLSQGGAGGNADKKKEEEEEEVDDSPIDEEGVDAKDIDLVMQQVSCSRRKAVKALKESNGDLINAIMACS
ncbi:hypothetical protein CBS101457_003319 [Exobasidium rhododendri]|nr:hypothetical protein CBS101457_003319 [Exobasidium rhododendri]